MQIEEQREEESAGITPTLEHSFRFVEADLFELMMT